MDLPELHAQIWQELTRCIADRAHGWRTPVLASRDGEGADARTVVLREVEPEPALLRLYTDARSPKVAQLQQQPRATLVAWCPHLGWQLRLRVQAQVVTGGLAVSSRWAKVMLRPSAQDYLSPLPPGQRLDLAEAHPPERASLAHFALLELHVLSLDWLGLRSGGAQQRAVWDENGARWVAP